MRFRVQHVHLRGEDPRRSAQWYVDNLGANIVNEITMPGGFTVQMDLNGLGINISNSGGLPPDESGRRLGLDHIAIETNELDEAMKNLHQNGAKILDPIREYSTGTRAAFIEGPDNVRMELVQEEP